MKRITKSQLHGYPRPLMQRADWTNLNGEWDFVIDHKAELAFKQVEFTGKILVPFAPETPASLVADQGFFKAVWYRRRFVAPSLIDGEKLVLHFGAVDWRANVYVNGSLVASHDGGYTPFSVDITEQLKKSKYQTIVVQALDDPHDMAKPRGKQDWLPEAHSIWYPRTTGIWQTVWMEVVPAASIASLRWSADVPTWSLGLSAKFSGVTEGMQLKVAIRHRDKLIVNDAYGVVDGQIARRIDLPDPGIEDARAAYLWSPENPQLFEAELTLVDGSGKVVDRVSSYTAMRTVAVDDQRFLLNGRPYNLRLVLDQGYWLESGMTAASDEALRKDVELTKAMGFNGVRKHQKIEDPRFLYWADRLGLMVWEEMPSPYAFTAQATQRLLSTWTEAIERDISHPCIVAWVPYNESWGLPDLTKVAAQRDSQRALYYLTKSLDQSRPVIGNDGWEMVAGDILAVHDYDGDANRLRERYSGGLEPVARGELFAKQRPGYRELLLDRYDHSGRPVMLTEFGGICYSPDKEAWGYKRAATVEEFSRQVGDILAAVHAVPCFAGFCYTQLTDTYQEANGLLFMDRTPKYPIEEIARQIRG